MNTTKKLLASANTGNGFLNHFNQIHKSNNYYQFILKGSPGSGKSTLMKKISKYFENENHNVEIFYCSSDITSLDCICIDDKVSVVDGTAPHITECHLPKIDSEIINLGECIEFKKLKNKDKIDKKLEKKQYFYQIIYKNLKIAKEIDELLDEKNKQGKMDSSIVNYILSTFDFHAQAKQGMKRNLFLSAITEKGIVNFCENNCFNIMHLNDYDVVSQKDLKTLSALLSSNGYDIIEFNNIINPQKLDALLIEDKNLLILNKPKINKKSQILINQKNRFIISAGKTLHQALKIHKQIESIYIKNLNFKKLDMLTLQLIQKINAKLKT